MYHSISIGGKNTWDDWFLIPTTRPAFALPPVKTNFIEIPGVDGYVDLTQTLTGNPIYGPRTGSFEFAVDNDHKAWTTLYYEIAEHLHGKVHQAILEDDPYYYYEGRFSVGNWKSGASYSTISISYTVDPFKRSRYDSSEDWLWDPFDFKNHIIIEPTRYLAVTDSLTITLNGSPIPASPIITSNTAMTLLVDGTGVEYPIRVGSQKIEGLLLGEGLHYLTFKGNGVVGVNYREMSL